MTQHRLQMKLKRRVVVPNEVMALLRDGSIHHLRPGQRAPGEVVHTWPFIKVGVDPGTFMQFLLDAKRRGATQATLKDHFDRVSLGTWVTDGAQVLGITPKV
jgi:hypothetical protein